MLLFATSMAAQKALSIHRTNGVTDMVGTSAIEEVTFSSDGTQMTISAAGTQATINAADIESMSYDEIPASATITYEGTTAKVVNPYFMQGVTVTVAGADVTIDNTNVATECFFELTGSTTAGSFLYNGNYKTTFVLNNVSITNPNGAAIDIQCGKRIAMELKKGTTNTLVDGAGGSQKAALYCKGHLEIDKTGTLNVTGNAKHAIAAKEYIQLKKSDGKINILGAASDGIHCGQYFLANGYTVTINNTIGDGIQAEESGVLPYEEAYTDGSIWIQGGNFTINCASDDVAGLKADSDININDTKSVPTVKITMTGAGAKGMSAGGNINITAGNIDVVDSGTGIVYESEIYTAKCLGADGNINLTGGNINLTATGAGGKGMKADKSIFIGNETTAEGPLLVVSTTGGTFSNGSSGSTSGGGGRPGGNWRPGGNPDESNDGSSSPKAIKAMAQIIVYGGNTTITTTGTNGEGMEGKTGVSINSGNHYMKCTDDCINSGGQIFFNGGTTVCCSTGNDAIDSNHGKVGAIVIGDGNLLTYSLKGGPEMGLDCDGMSFVQVKGNGTVIALGGNQGGASNSTINTTVQGYAILSTSLSHYTGRYYTLANASGENILTYSLEGNVNSSCTFFTSGKMTKGATYTLKYSTTAPTDASNAFHGFYLGSTSKGTTQLTSFTAK